MMGASLLRSAVVVTLILFLIPLPAAAQNQLVDMVPNARSGQTNQNAEPTLTIDPNNFSRMAGSAFTWDNLTGGPMVTNTAPIYVTTDGGSTWTLAFIVPSQLGSGFPTGDITLSFSSTLSGAPAHKTSWLYGGILAAGNFPMVALRAQDPFGPQVMTALDTRVGNVDQPHTIAKTTSAHDKLYIGFNNGWGCGAPGGRTSTVDVSQDAAVATPTLGLELIEARNTSCQDGFAQVPAANSDGTVYAAFLHDWCAGCSGPRLVVVRDDHWGIGPSPFTALTDPSDSQAGRFVTGALTLPSGFMGQNRLGASNISTAVDPNYSNRVYVAWGDSNGANSETVHVRRSIDSGRDWSGDLLAVPNAMNPEIAIDDDGVVGVLYQRVNGGRWETRLALSNDIDATAFGLPGTLLANQDATTPFATYYPYIGDYASLVTAGRNFFGIFSASNYPNKANFMPGVRYQREVDWTTHRLYADTAHTVLVPPSIDPFFFEVDTNVCQRFLCNPCLLNTAVCYGIYDPWWWLKCPACELQIYLNPGDEFTAIEVFNTLGLRIGNFRQLRQPVVVKGVDYTYEITLKVERSVGFVLRGELAPGKRLNGSFSPAYIAREMNR